MEIILGEKAEKTGVSDEGERERRKDLLARIRSGELDDRQIEVELEEKETLKIQRTMNRRIGFLKYSHP